MNAFIDHCARHAARRDANANEFVQTFGVSLSKYWNNLTGFDVIAFDDFIKPRQRESTAQAVKRKYGQAAVNLIHRLIGS